MHFVGMLAFHLPIQVIYDTTLTIASIFMTIFASGLALYIVRKGLRNQWVHLISTLVMATGIVGMHYTGMTAMMLSPPIVYDPFMVSVSIAIAILASYFAIQLSFSAGDNDALSPFSRSRAIASVMMGIAITGMHYSGMAAASFPDGALCTTSVGGIGTGMLSFLIIAVVIFILLITLILVMVDLKLADKDHQLLISLQRHNFDLKIRAENIAEEMTREIKESSRKDQLLAAIVEQSCNAILTFDRKGKITIWNRAASRMFGYSKDEVIGLSIDTLFPAQVQTVLNELKRITSYSSEIQTSCITRDRRIFMVVINVSPQYDAEERQIGAIANIRDITSELANHEQLTLWASVYENSGEGIIITDRNNNIVSINSAFARITGYPLDDLKGRNPRILSSGEQSREFYKNMWRAINRDGVWRGELWNRKKTGTVYPLWMTINAVHGSDDKISHYIAICTDITDQKQREEYINHLAQHDALTGLPNRILLTDRLEQAIINARRHHKMVAVLFLDLDHFKNINDSLGHDVGDALLIQVADRLRSMIREGDTICRQGGDEFIIVLNDFNESSNLIFLVEKIQKELSRTYTIHNSSINISSSIGVSIYPDDGETLNELVSNADLAMYHAKAMGRNNFQFFTQQLNETIIERMNIEREINHALERDEFSLHFQPQYSLDDGQVIGAEVLIRWNSPVLGNVPPDRFIPLSEDSGQIVQIGTWVLHRAIDYADSWRDLIPNYFRFAINVSVKQLIQNGFFDDTMNTLKNRGVSPHNIEIEITETALMEAVEKSAVVLENLQDNGITLAVDDFGSGYSSLNYLRQLPIDKLKIDRSFINNLPEEDDDREIANAIISMGHGLRLTVIAEGVENERQADFLKLAGCDEVQGYFYNRPMAAEDFELLLKQRKR
jgi:diguanylate cyclase (GGDEF)-like protein/PAS domain S-box-containing protein